MTLTLRPVLVLSSGGKDGFLSFFVKKQKTSKGRIFLFFNGFWILIFLRTNYLNHTFIISLL